jgi:predicted GIY-YIG superfamily endonuclease
MSQLLLIPDPRPLVERLGPEFFRQAPESPGVYLMRDAGEAVLYVGKAKNLRRRLASYRVANPDRMPRRHLRLLRAVARIEFQECPSESAALARESELLRNLRPRFNRAGTWSGPRRLLAWKSSSDAVRFAVGEALEPGWRSLGPIGSGAPILRSALLRLLWCALFPERGLAGLPEGWFRGRHGEVAAIPVNNLPPGDLSALEARLNALFTGCPEEFEAWIGERTAAQTHPFEAAVRDADLETVLEFAARNRTELESI